MVLVFPIPCNTSKDGISDIIIWFWSYQESAALAALAGLVAGWLAGWLAATAVQLYLKVTKAVAGYSCSY